MKTDANILEAYVTKLKKVKGQLPSHADQSRPHISRISVASGIPRRYFYTPEGCRRLNLAIQEIGLSTRGCGNPAGLKTRVEEDAECIESYLRWLESYGMRLPENPTLRGQVFLEQLEIEAGLRPATLDAHRLSKKECPSSHLMKMIESSVLHLGLEVRVLTQCAGSPWEPLTYEMLLEKGTEERRHELANKRNATQQLYNTRSKLRLFCASLGLDLTARVGDEFTVGFEASVNKVFIAIKSVSSGRKFHTEINRWADYYRRMVKPDLLPENFTEAFRHLVDMSGLSLLMWSKLLNLNETTLRRWYKGQSIPRSESLAVVSRMEALCKLPAGVLFGRLPQSIQRRRVSFYQLPESLRQDERLAYRVREHLPDNFPGLPLERQHEICESIRNNILKSNTPYNLKLVELRKLPYCLKEWPAAAAEEFEELAFFKTADMPPLGMSRNGQWKPSSMKMARGEFGSFFGALRLPADAADVRVRSLGVPAHHLTLALVACPLVVGWFIGFRFGVRTQYTEYTIKLLKGFMSLLREETGWLRQMPQLAQRLRPIRIGGKTLLSPESIRRARSDWDGICEEAVKRYRRMCRSEIKRLANVARDPFLTINGIVKMDDPTDAFDVLLLGMRDELPNLKTQPVRYHAAIRDLALVVFIAMTGFRRKTIVQLDYAGDESGHLMLGNDCIFLDVPRHFLKDPNSPFFGPKNGRVDYSNAAPNVFGLVDIFKEYLTISRPFLLNTFHPNCGEQPLFITSVKDRSARMSPEQVSEIYHRMTRRYLAENKWRGTGIKGVRASRPHSARHIPRRGVPREAAEC